MVSSGLSCQVGAPIKGLSTNRNLRIGAVANLSAYSDEIVHEFRGCRPLIPIQGDHRFQCSEKLDVMLPEPVVGMARNGWTASIGIDGRHGPDYAP
jgi:hypothetical protein